MAEGGIMKKYLLVMLSCLVVVPIAQAADQPVSAGHLYKQEIELTRAALETQRKSLIAGEMMLGEAASTFWPVYNEYRAQMRKINDKLLDVITEYATAYRHDDISDKQAGILLKRYMNALEDRIRLKKRFIPKFNKVLPKKKVVRFYQLDHRLDLLVQSQIAGSIPLM